jgi:hypothetical protein
MAQRGRYEELHASGKQLPLGLKKQVCKNRELAIADLADHIDTF